MFQVIKRSLSFLLPRKTTRTPPSSTRFVEEGVGVGGIILLLLLSPAHALDTDFTKPLNIQSDWSQYDYNKKLNYFEGHVKIDQGTTHLLADRVITQNNAEQKIKEATAYGLKELAHYWTSPKPGELPVHARAKIIRFFNANSTIVLEGEVMITQGENTFKGPLIIYNMQTKMITVPPSKEGHATIVYTPK